MFKQSLLLVLLAIAMYVSMATAQTDFDCGSIKKRDACNAFGGGIVCQWDHNPRKQKPGVGECVAFVSKAPTFAPTNKPTTAAPTTLQPTPAPVPCSSFNQKIGCCGSKFAKKGSGPCVNPNNCVWKNGKCQSAV